MEISDELQKLSKEELLALMTKKISELEKQNSRLENQNSRLENKNTRLENKTKKLEVKNRKLTDKLQKAREQLEASRILTRNHLELAAEMTRQAQCRVVVADEWIAKPLCEQLGFVFEESREWIKNAVTWRAQCYATGQDVKNGKITPNKDEPEPKSKTAYNVNTSGTGENHNSSNSSADGDGNKHIDNFDAAKDTQVPKETEDEKDPNKLLQQGILKVNHQVSAFIRDVSSVVKSLPEEVIKACPSCVKEIYNQKVRGDGAGSHKKNNTGKKKPKYTPTKIADGNAASNHICPYCGKPTEPCERGLVAKSLVTKIGKLGKSLEAVKVLSSIELCHHCHKVHGFFDEHEDLPVNPNRSIGLDFCLDACSNIFMGIPLNRLTTMNRMVELFGHSTVYNNLHDFVSIYIKPWYDKFMHMARDAEYILADGTPFACLEQQGRGCCQLKKTQIAQAVGETVVNEENELSTSNYILSICNGPLAKELFTCYAFLPTRSYKSIEKVITEDFKFKTIVCDAFGGYDILARKRGKLIQNCLVHLRRYNIKDCDPDGLAEEFQRLPKDERLKSIQEQFKNGSDRFLLLTVYTALSKIYALEGTVDLKAPDVKEQFIRVRQQERLLMNSMNEIMEELVRRHLEPTPNGKSMRPKRGDPFSRFPYYWYKRQENFKRFLDDPMLPPDTNMVEQSIRPLTILRKNSFFMAGRKGMDDLCMIYTVWASLKKNGVEDPAVFLRSYCRALYSHCFDKKYTAVLFKDGKYYDPAKLSKHIVTWDMQKLAEDFDFKKHFSSIK